MLACPPGDLLGHHAGLRANHQRLARWLPTYLRRYATAGGALAALLVLLHANVGGPTEALLALGCALVLGQLVVSGAVFIVLAVLRPR